MISDHCISRSDLQFDNSEQMAIKKHPNVFYLTLLPRSFLLDPAERVSFWEVVNLARIDPLLCIQLSCNVVMFVNIKFHMTMSKNDQAT